RGVAIETSGLQSIDRLIGTEMSGKGPIEQDVAFCSMDEEERNAIAVAIDGYERVPDFCAGPTEERLRKQPWGCGIVEDGKGCGVSQFALDEREQLRRSNGVAAQGKEFIVRANVANIEYAAPESDKSLEQFRLRFAEPSR